MISQSSNAYGDGASKPHRPRSADAAVGDSAGGWGTDDQAACQQSMALLIADEIIPRLLAAHRHSDDQPAFPVGSEDLLVALDPVRFADEALATDAGRLLEIAEAAISAGLGFESLLVDVMAPAARILGERWEDDAADFVEVTLGLWRLQELVHLLAVSRHLPAHQYDALSERQVLCAVPPGDTHSFGSVMLEEIFRRSGWSTSSARSFDKDELLDEVRSRKFDLIALTVSVEDNSATLSDLVAELRAASGNPDVCVMVGGPVFNKQPGLALEIGADATASDGRAALHKAEMLVGRLVVGRTDTAPRRMGQMPPPAGLHHG